MEEVFSGTWVEAELVNDLLRLEGIETMLAAAKGTDNSRLIRNRRAVYVLDRSRLERAREIVDRVRRGEPLQDPRSYRSWRCPACNELVEGQFAMCWKCGRAR